MCLRCNDFSIRHMMFLPSPKTNAWNPGVLGRTRWDRWRELGRHRTPALLPISPAPLSSESFASHIWGTMRSLLPPVMHSTNTYANVPRTAPGPGDRAVPKRTLLFLSHLCIAVIQWWHRPLRSGGMRDGSTSPKRGSRNRFPDRSDTEVQMCESCRIGGTELGRREEGAEKITCVGSAEREHVLF